MGDTNIHRLELRKQDMRGSARRDLSLERGALQADPQLREGRAGSLQVAATYTGAALLIAVVFYGINSQRPDIAGTPPATAQQAGAPDMPAPAGVETTGAAQARDGDAAPGPDERPAADPQRQ